MSWHFFTLLGVGFILGLKHALDADHVVAVSTMVSRSQDWKASSRLGAWWGAGHTLTLLAAGAVILGLRLQIPERLSWGFEFLVGGVLVILGVDLFRKMRPWKFHFHAHTHGQKFHAHFHSHAGSPVHNHSHKSFLIGLLHGLAGSGALMLLVLTTATSVPAGLLFIFVFGLGSVGGMLLMSTLLSVPVLLAAKFARLEFLVQTAAGTVSVVLGGIIMYETGVVHRLFLR